MSEDTLCKAARVLTLLTSASGLTLTYINLIEVNIRGDFDTGNPKLFLSDYFVKEKNHLENNKQYISHTYCYALFIQDISLSIVD